MDWNEIRAEYIAGSCTYRELAEKYGVSFRTLGARAKREGWADLRRQACDKHVTATIDTVSEASQAVGTQMQQAAAALIGKTMEGIAAIDPENARALKAYSGVLRDLKDVLDVRSKLDLEEQEARIEKLRREAQREQDQTREVSVTFGGAAEWAE